MPFELVSHESLQELVDEKFREGKSIDFKAELWRIDKAANPDHEDREKQTIEFLKDVSSFANTDGGHLIVGMKEIDTVATELSGIQVEKTDKWLNRLDQLLQNWVEPRLNASMRFITLSNRKKCASDSCAIKFNWSASGKLSRSRSLLRKKFSRCIRHGHRGTASAFNQSLTTTERIRSFHRLRTSLIDKDELPVILPNEPRFVFHLIPQSSFTSRFEFPFDQLVTAATGFAPPGHSSGQIRPSLDGVVTHYGSQDADGTKTPSFAQIFRNGVVEAAFTGVALYDRQQRKSYWSTYPENYFINAVDRYVSKMKEIAIEPPIWLFAAVCRTRDIYVSDEVTGDRRAFDRDRVELSEYKIEDMTQSQFTVIRPLLDQLWNAMGFHKCHRVSDDGQIVRLMMDRR